ncbi:MAG TPA: hypothetical protein VLR27_08585 [Acidimicrobiales bacterium]|nr:hypothetical protein [Acidimicrobiales bacterium]
MLGIAMGWAVRHRRAAQAGVLALLVAGGALLALRAGDDAAAGPRSGSELVDADPTQLLDPEPAPESYRIDYRVEGHGGDELIVTSDRLWVRRPWDSRLEVYPGATPDGEPDAVQVSAFGGFRADGEDGDAVVVASPPGSATSDVRIAGALVRAVEDGRAELVERRRVAERTCQVVRSATTLATGDLSPATGPDEYADTCIDASGLVLEEVLVSEGEVLLRRIATEVEISPDLDGVSFETGDPTLSVDEGGGFVAETEPGSRVPGRFFEPSTPPGFSRHGRFAVVPAQAENFTEIDRLPQRLTYISDVFVDGPDVIVLDQGGTVGNVDPFPALQGEDVDVAAGAGVLTYGLGGPTVIVDLGEGRFLRARGTVAPDLLIELLDGLEEVEGGELRLLEPAG